MRNFSLTGRFTFDEVQRLNDCTLRLAPESPKGQRCTFVKRRPSEVSSDRSRVQNCFSTRLRPARTPPSTFLFLPIHFSNSPEIVATSCFPVNRKASRSSTHPRTVGCGFTVPVRSFRGAPSRRLSGRRADPRYIGRAPDPCQLELADFFGPGASISHVHTGVQRPAAAASHSMPRRTQAIFMVRP